ncbi:5717_t:CDS:2 [Cetraspora pellucida]|uniref:5717_t:CDS:1 n=1 Tax=Cetraspora pellucida TaxID=1433469 RepID=A0A9N8W4D6_9GLOM|nr:5717_t:CDS:2 [Cetraspora pellucida]
MSSKISLTNDQHKKICIQKQNNLTMTQEELAKWAKEEFVLQPQLDEALANWVLQCQARKIQLTGKLIHEKRCKLAEQIGLNPQDCNTPDFSVGWLLLFEQCYNFKMHKIHGEKTITNCFHHTGLFDYEITTAICKVYPNDEDLSVLTELEESLQILSSCHPMSIAHYTSSPEETDIVHQEFTDADLLASMTPENDDTDSINKSNSSFITPSNPVRLDAIRTVISLLDTTISDHNTVLRTLHSLQ